MTSIGILILLYKGFKNQIFIWSTTVCITKAIYGNLGGHVTKSIYGNLGLTLRPYIEMRECQ